MTFITSTLMASLAALVIGGLLGGVFGSIQITAQRQQEKRLQQGKFKSGWVLLPGSGGRVAFLLLALALIQLVCPMLFADGIQWWVSAGVLIGYGIILGRHLRQRTSSSAV